jgi:hypothetical protein
MDFFRSSSSGELRLGDREETPWSIGQGFVSCRDYNIVVVAEKKCCWDADRERSDERTKATSSYVELVGLKVFSSLYTRSK